LNPDNSPVALTPADVQAIVSRAIDRYILGCHARVDAFVDTHFSLTGALRLHRHAVGLDLVRAPANVALALPYVASQGAAAILAAAGAHALSAWLRRRRIFLATAVARELSWRLQTDLLALPCTEDGRHSDRDALAEAILADPELTPAVAAVTTALTRSRAGGGLDGRLADQIRTYAEARGAAAELVNSALLAGTGAVVFTQVTPTALSLGPVVAAALAHQAAIAAFPLGAGIGSLWYALFQAEPSLGLIASVTGGLVLASAIVSAFAGIISDPLLRVTGLHQRRLHHLIDSLAAELRDGATRFRVRDHYVARVFDLLDLARTVLQLRP
jgi:hypothetical protein